MGDVGSRRMPKRRTTILGLGALAMGSGAAFTSATFQNSVDADADMRVIVDERLTVRAGELFDGLNPGDVDAGETFTAIVDSGDTETPSDILFDDDTTIDDNGTEYETVLTEDDDKRIPTPAAVANDGENGDFAFAIAVDINDDVSFDELIEIDNELERSVEAGITFETFGEDASEVDGGKETVATEIYQFEDSSEDQISPDSDGWEAENDQEPANRTDINIGEDEQITLKNDTGGGSVDVGDLRSAIEPEPAFGRNITGLDLVDTIEVGIGDSEE